MKTGLVLVASLVFLLLGSLVVTAVDYAVVTYTTNHEDATPWVMGDFALSATPLSFNCKDETPSSGHVFVAPQPRPSCWVTNLNGKNVSYGETTVFPNNVSVYYQPVAEVYYGTVTYPDGSKITFKGDYRDEEDWTNVFHIGIPKNGIRIDAPLYTTYTINAPSVLTANLTNTLAKNINGGYELYYEKTGVFTQQTNVRVEMLINNGVIHVPINTSQIGVYKLKTTPYITLKDSLLGDVRITFNNDYSSYNVLPKLQEPPSTTTTPIPNGVLITTTGTNEYVTVCNDEYTAIGKNCANTFLTTITATMLTLITIVLITLAVSKRRKHK